MPKILNTQTGFEANASDTDWNAGVYNKSLWKLNEPTVAAAPMPAVTPAADPKVQMKDVNGNQITVYQSDIPNLIKEGTLKDTSLTNIPAPKLPDLTTNQQNQEQQLEQAQRDNDIPIPNTEKLAELNKNGLTAADIIRKDANGNIVKSGGTMYIRSDSKFAQQTPAELITAPTDNIQWQPGLSDAQKNSIKNLIQNKPRDQWTAQDVANYNFATGSKEQVSAPQSNLPAFNTGTGETTPTGTPGATGVGTGTPTSRQSVLDEMTALADTYFANKQTARTEAEKAAGISGIQTDLVAAQKTVNDTMAQIETTKSQLEAKNILNEESKVALQNKIEGQTIPMSVINKQLLSGLDDMNQAQRLETLYDTYSLNTSINLYNAQLRNVSLLQGKYDKAMENVKESVADWTEWQDLKLKILQEKGTLAKEEQERYQTEINYERGLLEKGYVYVDNETTYNKLVKDLNVTASNYSQFFYKDPANGKIYLRSSTTDESKLVQELITKYPDAGISLKDNLATAQSKLNNSQLYQKEASDKTTYGKIGVDENGQDVYGFIDTGTKKITPTTTDVSKGIVSTTTGDAYDIKSYATDPNHEKAVQNILNGIGQFKTVQDIDNYIKMITPDSPITGQMIADASAKYGVSWEAIVAIMQQDSSLGTEGAGAKSFNPGNVGNTETATSTGKLVNMGSWQNGVDAVAKNLAGRKVAGTIDYYADFTKTLTEQGKAYFETLSDKDKGNVAQIVSGDALASDITKGLGGAKYASTLLTMATKVDPTYSENNNKIRFAFKKRWDSGNLFDKRTYLNTALGHLAVLQEQVSQLSNEDIRKYNSFINFFSKETGNPIVSTIEQTMNQLSDELANVYKGGNASATETDVTNQQKILASNFSPAQLDALITNQTKLLASKLNAWKNEYATTMGRELSDPIIQEDVRQELINAGIDPSIMESGASNNSAGNNWISASGNNYILPY